MFDPYFIAVVPMMVEGMYKNIIATAKRTKKYNLLMFMIKISNFLRKFKIDLRHLFFGNIFSSRSRAVGGHGWDDAACAVPWTQSDEYAHA